MAKKSKKTKEKSEITVAKYSMIAAWAFPVSELIKQIGRVIVALINR